MEHLRISALTSGSRKLRFIIQKAETSLIHRFSLTLGFRVRTSILAESANAMILRGLVRSLSLIESWTESYYKKDLPAFI